LLVGCAISGLALLPAARLRFAEPVSVERRVYRWNPFLIRFLAAIAIWNLATGAFNPFFNAYFSRQLGAPVERIGVLFSVAQLAQVVALLFAPAVLRRLGLVAGIASMQLATAAALAGLGASGSQTSAALAYTGYMAFQWMSEPGLSSLLMANVRPAEQSGASALNYFAIFSFQALAGAVAGSALAGFGYPAVLGAAAAVASAAGLLFWRLLGRFEAGK
jgi:predicted MFS family arabinose efflux permease